MPLDPLTLVKLVTFSHIIIYLRQKQPSGIYSLGEVTFYISILMPRLPNQTNSISGILHKDTDGSS